MLLIVVEAPEDVGTEAGLRLFLPVIAPV